jgi:uncharacterized protein
MGMFSGSAVIVNRTSVGAKKSPPGRAGWAFKALEVEGVVGITITLVSPHSPRHPPSVGIDPLEVDRLLSQLPAPFEPFDASALDGFLVGLLLQPQPIEAARWRPYVLDQDGRAPPSAVASDVPLDRLLALAERRHDELNRAIAQRQWFDPWVFELDAPSTPAQAVLPWIAGWAAALEVFPGLLQSDNPALREPLATLFAYFDLDDLDDVDDIADLLAEMAPAETMQDAVEDLVRSSLLIADVSRPLRRAGAQTAAPRKTARGGHPPARRAHSNKR